MLVVQASEGAPIRPGTVYVTPPDRHLLISEDHIHLSRGAKEGLALKLAKPPCAGILRWTEVLAPFAHLISTTGSFRVRAYR